MSREKSTSLKAGRRTQRAINRYAFIIFTCILMGHMTRAGYAQEVGLDDGVSVPLYNVQAGLDGNYGTGNFEQRRVNGRATLFKRWGDQASVLSRTTYNYMRSGDLLFADDLRSVMILTHQPLSPFQLFTIALYHNSHTRFIDERWMGGMGGAWSPLRSPDHQLKIGASVAYELTQLESRPPPFSPPPMSPINGCLYKGRAGVRSCERQMWRVIPRLIGHHSFLEGHLITDYEALWVVDPLDLSDERVYASVTLSIPLVSWLSVYTHYDISFESVVLDHRERLDAHLTFGFKASAREGGPSPK